MQINRQWFELFRVTRLPAIRTISRTRKIFVSPRQMLFILGALLFGDDALEELEKEFCAITNARAKI
jgi:hypothetical protein